MATLRMALALPRLATANATKIENRTPANNFKNEVLTEVAKLMEDVAGGWRSQLSGQAQPSFQLSIDENATAATGTITLASVANNDTVNIAGVTLTAKTSSPGANQWLVGVSDTADAAALVVLINAHATLSQYFLASSALGVVTLTAIGPALGVIGNGLIVSSSNGTRLACVAMSGGADDSNKQTYTF